MFGMHKRNMPEQGPHGPFPEGCHHENMAPEPMNRSVSRLSVIISVLYVLVGVVMLVWTNTTLELLGVVIGIGMLAAGITRVIVYFTRNHYQGIMEMDLTLGVTFASFGLFMLLHKDTVKMMLPFAVSIMLLIGAISKLQYSLDLKHLAFKNWRVFLGFTGIVFALGIILICNPFTSEHVLVTYMAVSLIIEGILNIIAVILLSGRLKKMANGSFVVSNTSAAEMFRQGNPAGGPQNGGMPFQPGAQIPAQPMNPDTNRHGENR